MMYGLKGKDGDMHNNIFRSAVNAQHFADSINEKLGEEYYEVVPLFVVD